MPLLRPVDDFLLTWDPLDVAQLSGWASDPRQGAVVVMLGTVRSHTQGRAVSHLDYEAYESMALKVFASIAGQIREQWPATVKIAIHHRLGRLPVSQTSVIIAIGSPHRAEAFAACQYAIDTLKHDAPIWKKEFWADGKSDWVIPNTQI